MNKWYWVKAHVVEDRELRGRWHFRLVHDWRKEVPDTPTGIIYLLSMVGIRIGSYLVGFARMEG